MIWNSCVSCRVSLSENGHDSACAFSSHDDDVCASLESGLTIVSKTNDNHTTCGEEKTSSFPSTCLHIDLSTWGWLTRLSALTDLHVDPPSIQVSPLHLFLGFLGVFWVFVFRKTIPSGLLRLTPSTSWSGVRLINNEAIIKLAMGLEGSSEAIF